MTYKIIIALVLALGIQLSQGQTINPKELDKQIADLNAMHSYEVAIVRLEDILNDPKATAYDRYNAYLQKALTHKRLYNYSTALENLSFATKEKVAPKYKDEVETRVLIERLLIFFDLQDQVMFDQLLVEVDEAKLHLIDPSTQAFYTSVLGILEMRKGNYSAAETRFQVAQEMLERHSPKDLPNLYRAKMVLYGKQKNHKKVFEAYEAGKMYANRYSMDLYKIIMEESITHYYASIPDFERAYLAQKEVTTLRSKYDANNHVGRIANLEQEILKGQKEKELKDNQTFRYYLIFTASILAALVVTLIRLYIITKEKSAFIAKENETMRKSLEILSAKLTKEGGDKLNFASFQLSPRHLEIIELIRQGKTNKEIGMTLFISENTVKYHLKLIYEALGIENRIELRSVFFRDDNEPSTDEIEPI